MELAAVYIPVQTTDKANYTLNIALLGFDIKTDVTSGENRDRELKHDFAVLGYKTLPLYKTDSGHAVMTELPDIVETVPRMAISAWVSTDNNMTPIQAVGGWLEQ